MADRIEVPLYYERMGRTGPVMAFVHPNPMDQSCWIYQMAHMSTWFRCIAIDIPGYGRSPKARPGLTMDDMGQACWKAIDDAAPGERAILVLGDETGCVHHGQRQVDANHTTPCDRDGLHHDVALGKLAPRGRDRPTVRRVHHRQPHVVGQVDR